MREIKTARLRMRDPSPDDLEIYLAFVSDYEVVKWTSSWPYPADREFTLSRCQQIDPENGFVGLIFQGDEHIGGMSCFDGALGYFIARDHWGKGYATEMAQAAIARAFAVLDWDQITAEVMQGNDGSQRVLEKLGFVCVGDTRCVSQAQGGEFVASRYVLTRAKWLAANPYEVRSDRLIIRGLREGDWRDLQVLGGVPEVARMMFNVTAPWAEADVKAWLEMSKWRGQVGFRPAVTLLDGTLIGTLGIGGDPVSCAYFLGQDFWGKGYATEAMAAFLPDVFERFSLTEITASHFDDNPASGRVLAKLGFERTGIAMGSSAARLEDAPETLYRLSRNQLRTMP